MKKQLLFISAILFSVLSFGQIGIVDDEGNNVENTAVDVYAASDFGHIETDFKTQNLSGQSNTYNMKRYELEYILETQEYYCWTLCLGPVYAGTDYFSVFPEGPGYLTLAAGADGNYGTPAFHFNTNDQNGTAIYRYVIYNTNDVNDSAYVDMVYHIGTVGVNEYSNNAISNVYPNPANDFVYINLNENILNPRFEIYSIVGNKVQSEQIINQNGKVKIDVSNLNPGIYMVQELNSQITRKFIISR